MRGKSKQNFSGQLTALAQRRITKEKQRFETERKELHECGIYTCWGDELSKFTAMVVGPEGTPYEFGFYFFDIHIPDDYPMHPPHVDFKTGDGRVRFNPNLYVEGKVCLSILGTWSGPSWTTSCTLRTVLVSIQSLLNEHPIQNEPGHEKETGKNDQAYSEIIRYENIAVAVVRMLRHTPARFKQFRPQMRQTFLNNFDKYIATLEAYKSKDGKEARSPIWNFVAKYRTQELITDLQALKTELEKEEREATKEDQDQEEPSEEPPAKRAKTQS
eukprot:TRINITY_DN31925_c0_g2_i1.p1 TRINITY_DN31925_c0_g2~~TRINITY_DN31925_c0_g2_i1.p1  ORF type:complete len:273 (+),score=41.86 TRINITY_DN31925_c0_g2_i1:94-912(+)